MSLHSVGTFLLFGSMDVFVDICQIFMVDMFLVQRSSGFRNQNKSRLLLVLPMRAILDYLLKIPLELKFYLLGPYLSLRYCMANITLIGLQAL